MMGDGMRRLCLVAAAVLLIVLLSAFAQSGTVPIHLDVAGLVTKAIYGALGLVGAGALWVARQTLATLKSLDKKVSDASQQLNAISHELFGVSGTNGMRADVKEAKRLLRTHAKVLTLLADRQGIAFDEEAA